MKKSFRRMMASLAGLAVLFTAAPAAADGMPEDPLARFEDPLCPGIIGLQVDFALAMVERIRDNALRFGLRVADADNCDANLIVAFLNDGQNYLQRLNAERGYLFESLSRMQKRELLGQTGPTRAWITTEVRTRDGMQVGMRENLVDVPQAGMWSAHSMIYVPTRRDITASMVLIDRGSIDGLSVNQLADYASLTGFADFVPAASPATPSIQRLFDMDRDAAPEGLTAFDVAYLERLYSSIPNLPAYARLEGLEGLAQLEE